MSGTYSQNDVVSDRYRLETFIGAGGVSKAWLGRDDRTGRRVVVKHPNYESDNSQSVVRESIEREIEVLESIEAAGGHPNLMRLIDRTTSDGEPVLVVEYIEGQNLYSAVKQRGGFTNPEAIRTVGLALCDALSFLHENEIMYRDLKPNNVMLGPDLTPTLIDFNTARGFVSRPSVREKSKAGTVVPSPVFNPPELNHDPAEVGYRQGPWSDVYSIGKVLLFMYLDHAPRDDGVDIRAFETGNSVPKYLAESIQRATRTHKDDRYRNATVFTRVLRNRSAKPRDRAKITHLQTGRIFDLRPGDTIGRAASTGPEPSIAIEKDDGHISAIQVQFDTDRDGNWLLQDRSLNGTWIRRGESWQRLLSARGQKRQNSHEQNRQPESTYLNDGDYIALVHPTYDVWLRFEEVANR